MHEGREIVLLFRDLQGCIEQVERLLDHKALSIGELANIA